MDIIFLPFSLEPGLAESRPDLPLEALARQVPQVLCSLAHGQAGIRGRFFPFVGSEDGERSFVGFQDLLPPEQVLGPLLSAVTPQPALVIDGHIGSDLTTLRSLEEAGFGPEATQISSFPSSIDDPRVLLNRITLELWDVLDLGSRVKAPPGLGREALWLYLEGKDRELSVRAGLEARTQDPFAPYVQALALEPGSRDLHEALLELAALAIREHRHDPLLAAAALAHAADNGDVDQLWLSRAFQLSQQSGHNEATLSIGRSLLVQAPEQQELALSLARYLAGSQRYTEARDLLVASLPENSPPDEGDRVSQRGEMLALLFQLSSTLGDEQACDRWMAALLACTTRPPSVIPLAAHWLMDQDLHDEAQALLDEVLQDGEAGPEIALEQGRLLMLQGREREAHVWLERALDGEPHLVEEARRLQGITGEIPVLARLHEIEALNRAGSTQEALSLARSVVKDRPDLAESWYALSLVRSTLGQARRAIRALREALRRKQDYTAARNRLGILLVSTGRYRQGYEELARVLETETDIMSPLLHMTQACYYLKRHEEGVQYLERAEALFPDHPAVRQTRMTFYPAP